jgi:hypothetical protein
MSSQMTISSPSAAKAGSAKAGSAKAGSAKAGTRRVKLAHNQSLLQVTASAIFGIRFRRELMITQKKYPAESEPAADDYDNDEKYVNDDFIISAKTGKTRHAPNGRQKQRQAKNVELNNEIKKAVKRNAKIDQSQLPETNADQGAENDDDDEQGQAQQHTRPSKREQRQNTQYRTAKYDLKTLGGAAPFHF